jgi:hypothetical protein
VGLNQAGDGGVAGHTLQAEQQAGVQHLWRRACQYSDCRSVVVLGDGQRGIAALSL